MDTTLRMGHVLVFLWHGISTSDLGLEGCALNISNPPACLLSLGGFHAISGKLLGAQVKSKKLGVSYGILVYYRKNSNNRTMC